MPRSRRELALAVSAPAADTLVGWARRYSAVDAVSRVSVEVSRHENAVVLRVTGDVDMASAPTLTRTAREALLGLPAILVFDLRAVDMFGSAGVRSLFAAAGEADETTSVRVAADSRLARIFQITGLDQTVPVLPDTDSALKY
jgi:anti-sigma B factor antagonist